MYDSVHTHILWGGKRCSFEQNLHDNQKKNCMFYVSDTIAGYDYKLLTKFGGNEMRRISWHKHHNTQHK